MELEIIAIYCWCELILNQLNIKDDWRAEMNNAEVITTAIIAVRFFHVIDRGCSGLILLLASRAAI